jgi:hypothetical protein
VVIGNCGSGRYCTARKIDKTLPCMIGDKGIDKGLALLGTSEPLSFWMIQSGNYQISRGQKAKRRWGSSWKICDLVIRREGGVRLRCGVVICSALNSLTRSGKSLLGFPPQHRLLSIQNIPDGMKAQQLRRFICSALALLSVITPEGHSRRP